VIHDYCEFESSQREEVLTDKAVVTLEDEVCIGVLSDNALHLM